MCFGSYHCLVDRPNVEIQVTPNSHGSPPCSVGHLTCCAPPRSNISGVALCTGAWSLWPNEVHCVNSVCCGVECQQAEVSRLFSSRSSSFTCCANYIDPNLINLHWVPVLLKVFRPEANPGVYVGTAWQRCTGLRKSLTKPVIWSQQCQAHALKENSCWLLFLFRNLRKKKSHIQISKLKRWSRRSAAIVTLCWIGMGERSTSVGRRKSVVASVSTASLDVCRWLRPCLPTYLHVWLGVATDIPTAY